jgi:hypothetical protein
MLVKVLGAPRIVDDPVLGRRELNVVVFVACSPRPVSHEHIQDAIWGGSAISTKSVFNLIGSARTALGRRGDQQMLNTATRPHNIITPHPDVFTDLQILRELVEAAEAAPSHDALSLLTEALGIIEGPPFDAAGYDWAITNQLVSEAEHLVERAACLAAELAIDSADLAPARWAVTTGLRAIPGDEALYRMRMRVEAAAGGPQLCVAPSTLSPPTSRSTASAPRLRRLIWLQPSRRAGGESMYWLQGWLLRRMQAEPMHQRSGRGTGRRTIRSRGGQPRTPAS